MTISKGCEGASDPLHIHHKGKMKTRKTYQIFRLLSLPPSLSVIITLSFSFISLSVLLCSQFNDLSHSLSFSSSFFFKKGKTFMCAFVHFCTHQSLLLYYYTITNSFSVSLSFHHVSLPLYSFFSSSLLLSPFKNFTTTVFHIQTPEIKMKGTKDRNVSPLSANHHKLLC